MKKKCLLIFVIFTPLLALSKKVPQEEVGSSWNYAYQNDFEGLFDQAEILSSEAYKNAESGADKEKILENYFLQKKMNAVWSSLQAPAAFLITVAASLGAGYYFKLHQRISLPTMNPVILASTSLSATITGLTFFFSPIQRFIEGTTSAVSGTTSSLYQYYSGSTFDNLEKYERRYIRKKPEIPIALQDSIEKQLRLARTGENNFSDEDGKKSAQLAVKLIHGTLSLPAEMKETFYDRDRFDKIFDCYNEDTKKELRRLVVRYIAKEKGQLATQKHAVYFKGAPGTGKTRAAKLLAEFLQVPYQEISLSEISKAKFVGTREGDGSPGLVANAMIRVGEDKNGFKNFLMLIDEADRILNAQSSDKLSGLPNYMLMYLDPNRKSYYNEFFEAYIDTDGIYTVLAGNFDIKDEALKNRLHIITFGTISTACKTKIVWDEYFPQIFSKYKNSKFKLVEADFTEEDRENINVLINGDVDPGMRTIYLELEKYLADIILDKLANKI